MDEQLEDAITESQEYWMQWVGRILSTDLDITAESREYPAALIGTDVDSVVDVAFDAYDEGLRDVFGWADVEINPYQWVYGGRGGYSAINQYMMYREDARKITSSDRDWEWDRTRRVLIISPRYSDTRKVKVLYLSRCFDFAYLTTYEWLQFRKYALAQAMKILATIRMKFPEKPGAAGQFTMDGETMWANAEALEMQVEEKMRLMQRPVGIFTD